MPERERDDPKAAATSATGSPSGRVTSKSLLERVRSNDSAAWSRLVHLYRPLVYYWCNRSGLHATDADDVHQEVFQAAARSLADFRHDQPGDTFRGWLRGITRNMLREHFRRQQRQPQAAGGSAALLHLQGLAGQEEHAAPLPDESDPPDELNGLYRRALELVRSEFEEKTWQAFWQVAVDGRSPADVAKDLGVTSAAVRQAKSRILRRLKAEVGDLAD